MYSEDELLMLSGIQHIVFCERQWALIHIEQQWSENVLTIEGHHMHERVDDPYASDNRLAKITWRALPLVSYVLGLYGRADVVELLPAKESDDDGTISVEGRDGRWCIHPVEYKRGKPKTDDCDSIQLCAQAMCLEEMHQVKLTKGALFYGETRHRLEVDFSMSLRQKVIANSEKMHALYSKGFTPRATYAPKCKSCSLINDCMPQYLFNTLSASEYLNHVLFSDTQ